MSKKMESFENKLMPVADKLANNRYLLAVRDGFMLTMPLLIIGSIFMLLAYLPINGYDAFMARTFGENWMSFFSVAYNTTMSVMTIFVILGISGSLSDYYKLEKLNTAVISLVAFFVLTPFVTSFTPEGMNESFNVTGIIPTEWMGTKGLFVGILAAILSTEIVRWVIKKGWVIKMPAGVPSAVGKAFSSLIPATITIIVFDIIRLIFTFTPFGTIHNFIYTILQLPLTSLGDTLGAALIANFFVGLFWIFGIVGADIVQSVMNPIWIALAADNLAAYQAGSELPHIITQQFNQIYLWMGGGGATLGLCIAILLVCKSEQCKKLGRLSIFPGIFNINEPLMFGLPIVLNPMMLIPFIITPLALCLLCYGSMAIGLVPKPNGILVPWTTPPIIGGFLVGGIRGALLQLVGLIVSFFIYLPFIKTVDKQYLEQEKSYKTAPQK
ncbi:PTS cellobiose transporter subunit IIC [Paratissierella segnis]|jgi:PTS system cellobiose-specific IIC component|uniref:Permease IIC component n=1 Tax=Paratissierella segnis TaxID=2763679 RepID=A0A926EWT6_9FIRM|nr:PTS cellobiose transporter subunit IIC [Paratissierella segnis]MBC8589041.1 PTS cellobiose transporter subunit IIC [Paratissierella segnis]